MLRLGEVEPPTASVLRRRRVLPGSSRRGARARPQSYAPRAAPGPSRSNAPTAFGSAQQPFFVFCVVAKLKDGRRAASAAIWSN
jgi:hypothetical protein